MPAPFFVWRSGHCSVRSDMPCWREMPLLLQLNRPQHSASPGGTQISGADLKAQQHRVLKFGEQRLSKTLLFLIKNNNNNKYITVE